MSPEREVSLGEVADDLKDLAREVRDFRPFIESTFVRRDIYDLAHAQLVTKVATLEASVTWAWRTAVTAILAPAIIAILVFLLNGQKP